jgi:hypothetical protein
MCCSAEEPHDIVPRVSKQELYDAFTDGWKIESVEPVQYELNPEFKFSNVAFSDSKAKGWFVVARRC